MRFFNFENVYNVTQFFKESARRCLVYLAGSEKEGLLMNALLRDNVPEPLPRFSIRTGRWRAFTHLKF